MTFSFAYFRLAGAYDGANSPFEFEINSIAEEIAIDLDKRKS
jgi:hypothetical protein